MDRQVSLDESDAAAMGILLTLKSQGKSGFLVEKNTLLYSDGAFGGKRETSKCSSKLHIIWAIYNDLSRGHPKWWFSKGIPQIWP